MPELNRRDFLKVLGVTSTATVAACDYVDPRTPYENVLPYVVVPDQILPGVATWFASACNECSAGCGILARNREGRVVKLEGNPDHPTNKGNLCSRGQAGLLATYSPDRFDGPRKGTAGLTWDDATKAVVEAIGAARAAGKEVAWLGRHRTGSLGTLITQVTRALGGREVHWEPLGLESLRAAVQLAFGRDTLPTYAVDSAKTVVTFGADFLTTWLSPTAQTLGFANSRDPKVGGSVSRFVAIQPRIGNTSAMADLHLAAVPGTEVGVALAVAKLLRDKNGYAGPVASLLDGVDVDAAATAAEIAKEKLEELAGWLAEGTSVVFPGGVDTSAAPTDLAIATLVLNEVAGNIGKTVVFGQEHNTVGQSSFRDVAGLLGDCAAGKIGVLFVDDLDVAYAMPAGLNAKDALAKVDLLVAFANEPMDTLTEGALVLPPGSTLETWGDNEAIRGRYALQQPAMTPLKDTVAIGETLLAVARALALVAAPGSLISPTAVAAKLAEAPAAPPADASKGKSLLGLLGTSRGKGSAPVETTEPPAEAPAPTLPGLSTASWRQYVADWWQAVVWPLAGSPGTFASFWAECQQRGGYFHEIAAEGASCVLTSLPAVAPATPSGSDPVLVLFPHPHIADGRSANRPWLQEIPEPLSTYNWGTWAEIHPDLVASLGLTKEDGVIVQTSTGSVEVAWFASPGIRKGTVAVVMGNGHENSGRYAKYGKNPVKLLTAKVDEASGALSYVSARASVKRSGNPSPAHFHAGSLTQEERGLNHTVYVGTLDQANGPGSLVSHHHPPMDERLIKAGVRDMYPEPEHPTYRFALAMDLNRCTGCGACQAACYAENNIPVVGPEQSKKSRMMGWIRLSRYWEGSGEHPDVRFQPVMCQQCSHAPCEGVCPVLATYHNLDGLNAMIYNRCVGTRYCANNCPYTARRFNYHNFSWPEPFMMMLNPDVSVRSVGVMEKCNFCQQRLRETKDAWRDQGHAVAPDAALQNLPACVQACPADAMVFGNLKDPESKVSQQFQDGRAYAMLGELNTKPGVRYLARVTHTESAHGAAHGGGHEGGSAEGHHG